MYCRMQMLLSLDSSSIASDDWGGDWGVGGTGRGLKAEPTNQPVYVPFDVNTIPFRKIKMLNSIYLPSSVPSVTEDFPILDISMALDLRTLQRHRHHHRSRPTAATYRRWNCRKQAGGKEGGGTSTTAPSPPPCPPSVRVHDSSGAAAQNHFLKS